MLNAIVGFSTWSCKQLESSLLPSKSPCVYRIAIYAYQFFKFCVFLPLAVASSILSFAATWILGKPTLEPRLVEFAKRPAWSEEPTPVPVGLDGNPIKIGFATADIQDSGPDKPQFQETNWGRFYQAHENGPLDQLPNTLENPEKLIEELEQLNIHEWRTSISLMPKIGERVNQVELNKYCHFFNTLENNGIHVLVTLNHFVNPEDLDWTQEEAIERFVDYATDLATLLYESGVRQILTFNEIMVQVFQGYLMGNFPPHHTFNLEGGCKAVENMMRAHTKTYEKLKAMYPDFEIGLTHDPIRFRHYHKWNPLWAPQEKIFAHYLTEITHNAYMRLLLTGKFELKVPFLANESFELPEYAAKRTRPLDFIGGQYYTDPLLKFPTGSVSRNEGEKLTAYGYRVYPQGLFSMLEEFRLLQIPIDLTEIGLDEEVNENPDADAQRIDYFEKIFQVVQCSIDQGIPVRSIYWWTKGRSWEWHKGLEVDFSWDDDAGEPRPLTEWLKGKLVQDEVADVAG